jgi:hypothetical protein
VAAKKGAGETPLPLPLTKDNKSHKFEAGQKETISRNKKQLDAILVRKDGSYAVLYQHPSLRCQKVAVPCAGACQETRKITRKITGIVD